MLELAIIAGVGIAVCVGAKALMADASAPAAAQLDDPAAGPPRPVTPPGIVPPPVVGPPGTAATPTQVRITTMPHGGVVFVDGARAGGAWEDSALTRWLVPLAAGPRVVVAQAPSGERRTGSVTAIPGMTHDLAWGSMRVETAAPVVRAPAPTPTAPSGGSRTVAVIGTFLGGLIQVATAPVTVTVRYDPGAYFRAVPDGRGGQASLPYARPLRVQRGPDATRIESATAFQVGDPGFSSTADRITADAYASLNAPGQYAYRAAKAQSALLTGDGGAVAATIMREPSGSKATFVVASPGNRITLKNACANGMEDDIGVMVYKAKPNELVITAPPPDGLDVTDPTFVWTMIAANETKTFTLVPPRAPLTSEASNLGGASPVMFLGR